MPGQLKVLCVEDNPADRFLIEELFDEDSDVTLHTVERCLAAAELLAREHFDVVLLDLSLPDSFGLDSYQKIKEVDSKVPVVIHSGNSDENTAIEAVRKGAQDYILKGSASALELKRTFNHAIERQKTRAQLSASEARYRKLYDTVLAGVFQIDNEGRLTAANSQMVKLLGYRDEADIVAADLRHEIFSSPECYGEFESMLSTGEPLDSVEFALRRKDGTAIIALMSATANTGPDGKLDFIEGTFVNITKRKEAEQEIKFLAQYDKLTGLANRHLFCESVSRAFASAGRNNTELALMFLDLDHFKEVNDTLGHDAGDLLLQNVASRMTGTLRESDLVSRLGGDEFAVLIEDAESGRRLAHIANKLLRALGQPFSLSGQEVYVTPSIGIATAPEAGSSLDELMKAADVAMYRAKAAGRNCFEFYSNEVHAEVIERIALEQSLRTAAECADFALEYQPLVRANSGDVIGFEALLRFRNERRGPVAPDVFVPLLESAGLISKVGNWVIEQSLRELRQWQKELKRPDFRVNVNVSTRQLTERATLVKTVRESLQQSGVEPACLELEITESVLMADVEECIGTLKALRALGVRIVVDDFGTGFSSLQYLKLLPIEGLKIDRDFVAGIPDNADDATIIEATIAMSKRLGLTVTLEGVETDAQMEYSRTIGCDFAQGFYFSRPLPPQAIVAFVKAQIPKKGMRPSFPRIVDKKNWPPAKCHRGFAIDTRIKL